MNLKQYILRTIFSQMIDNETIKHIPQLLYRTQPTQITIKRKLDATIEIQSQNTNWKDNSKMEGIILQKTDITAARIQHLGGTPTFKTISAINNDLNAQ